jgi:hypothetical protein
MIRCTLWPLMGFWLKMFTGVQVYWKSGLVCCVSQKAWAAHNIKQNSW